MSADNTYRLHLVGGFLGSGKTTAIIAAAKALMKRGVRVGVVTNDQGKYLVDTAFFKLSDLPTVEVNGGCFCCNYNDLEKQIHTLERQAKPDIIFAESVGSCADLVATVIKPLLQLRQTAYIPASLSVFTDARLLRLRLKDLPLPFSDNVIYIFDQQIEEADLLIINKIDLVSLPIQQELIESARQRYPTKEIIGQNSLAPDGITAWLNRIENRNSMYPIVPLSIDYQRYGAGEARLAWLDETLIISVPAEHARATLIESINDILANLTARKITIGHLKFLVSSNAGSDIKLSFTTVETPKWDENLPSLHSGEIHLMVNARVEMEAQALRILINSCFEQATRKFGGSMHIEQSDAFHPKFPKPTYRILDS